jgi:hypothetical protein
MISHNVINALTYNVKPLSFYSPSDLGRFFSFSIYTQPVGHLRRGSVRRKAATSTHNDTNRMNSQTSMSIVESEITISVFERAETVHALDRAATVIGNDKPTVIKYF